MFDIIGFWGNVTIITMFLLVVPFVVCSKLYQILICQITEDGDLAERLSNKMFDYRGLGNATFFNRFSMSSVWLDISSIISGLAFLLLILASHFERIPIYTIIAQVAGFVAPITGSLFVFFLCYLGCIIIGRKGYKLYIKVNDTLNKLDEKP